MGEAKLYVIPGSHPSRAAGLMLERKGIPYKRVDMIPGPTKQLWLRARGFPGDTVPALMLNGEKVQGSREISRALDRHQPDPALFRPIQDSERPSRRPSAGGTRCCSRCRGGSSGTRWLATARP